MVQTEMSLDLASGFLEFSMDIANTTAYFHASNEAYDYEYEAERYVKSNQCHRKVSHCKIIFHIFDHIEGDKTVAYQEQN